MFCVQIFPPPPPTHFFNFLYIVQYLFVHCTIPSILGSHPQYPTSPPTPNIAFTFTPTPPHQPDPPPPTPSKIFFFDFSQKLQFFNHIHRDPPSPTPPSTDKNFTSLFTSTLTPPRPPPPFFFEFSQLHFSVHIHPGLVSTTCHIHTQNINTQIKQDWNGSCKLI